MKWPFNEIGVLISELMSADIKGNKSLRSIAGNLTKCKTQNVVHYFSPQHYAVSKFICFVCFVLLFEKKVTAAILIFSYTKIAKVFWV